MEITGAPSARNTFQFGSFFAFSVTQFRTSTKLSELSLSLSMAAKSAMYVSLSMYVRNQVIASRYIIRTLAAAPIVRVVNGETLQVREW
jgi:hypothetical protein